MSLRNKSIGVVASSYFNNITNHIGSIYYKSFCFFCSCATHSQKKLEWKIISQFIVAFLFGNIVDFYNTSIGLKHLVLTSIDFKILMLLLANILTAIGVVIMIRANFVLNPPDGLVNTLSEKTHNSFGKTKVLFDLTMILSTLALSMLFIGNVSIIGIGTLVAVILVGNLVSLCNKVVKKYVPIKSDNKSN
ncbi:DUF6198 family protein [Leuconostoc suionicum]|uniref:DUF6198 family protein n=1 Tax=Leuconostoc suionicum TaxID=1511761 RepID=UPI0031454764